MRDFRGFLADRSETKARLDAERQNLASIQADKMRQYDTKEIAKATNEISRLTSKLSGTERLISESWRDLSPRIQDAMKATITDPDEARLIGASPAVPGPGVAPAAGGDFATESAALKRRYMAGEFGQPGTPEAQQRATQELEALKARLGGR